MAITYDLDSASERKRVESYERHMTGEDEQQTEEEAAAAEREARIQILQNLGKALLEKREEAMAARTQCGIEREWEEDEEFYQSIDSANPEGETNVGKPISSEGGPIGIGEQVKNAGRSSIFIPLTRPYVDGAHARVSDMLLPNDEWPFEFVPTKITTGKDHAQLAPQLKPVAQAAAGMMDAAPTPGPAMPAAVAAPAAPPMMGGAPNPGPAAPGPSGAGGNMGVPGSTSTSPEPSETEKTADELACEKAKDRIIDWLTECQFHGEYRKMLENCAKLGTGILKGPIPQIRVSQKMVTGEDGVKRLERVEETVPVSISIDPRNFYPDPGCGEDHQRGSYVWEFDTMSGRGVQDLLMDSEYVEEMIRKVLREGPNNNGIKPPGSPQGNASEASIKGSTFPVWYFHGMVEREALIASGLPEEELPEGMDTVPAIVTMINDTVVKGALAPMDAGGFPYDAMPWQRRAGMIWGMGVARQMRTPQRMLNGAARALMDNAAFTAGPMVGIREEWIKPVGGSRTVTPRQMFLMTKNAPDSAKIGDALSFTNIQAAQAELQANIQLAIKLAEVATGLPMILQGQQGDMQETATGRTIQNNNGSTVLRRIARQSDDYVMERHIRRYYQWLLENTDYDDAKGDLQIDCSASTALVDRELSNQSLVQLAPMLYQDPDVHKSRLNQEMLKAHRFDPKRIYMTDAEKRKRDETPPPPPPEVMKVMIKDKGDTERLQMKLTQEARENAEERAISIADLERELQSTLAAIAQAREANTATNQTRLAESVMRIRAQLAQGRDQRAGQAAEGQATRDHEIATAAYEPVGRAPKGQAFSQ